MQGDGEFAVIDVKGVSKRYKGGVLALDDVSLRVPQGVICGLLGPNGAGKSTLVKVLTTLVRPDRCGGVMLGYPIGRKEVLKNVGYLPEHARLPGYLTGEQMIIYAARLSGIPKAQARRRAGELMERTRIAYAARRKISGYSKGMRQLIGLCQALVHDPEVVILDEPTDGVDPAGRQIIRDVILELKAQGRTVLLNSHILAELEQMVDHLAILSQGRMLKQGRMADLMSPTVEVTISATAAIPADALPAGLWEIDGSRATATQPDEEDVQSAIDQLRQRGIGLLELSRNSESLESVFLRTVQESAAQAEEVAS